MDKIQDPGSVKIPDLFLSCYISELKRIFSDFLKQARETLQLCICEYVLQLNVQSSTG